MPPGDGPAPPALAGPRPGAGAPPHAALLRRVGARGIVALGFVAGLGWAFVGSLWLGLGTGGAARPTAAWLWLAGEVGIVAVAAAAARRAAGRAAGRGGA
jgi:hypothetical protein